MRARSFTASAGRASSPARSRAPGPSQQPVALLTSSRSPISRIASTAGMPCSRRAPSEAPSSAILRLYGPLDPWFDKTWRPGEIELVEGARPGVGDDVGEHVGLHLVLRGLEAGEQRDPLGSAGGEASDRHRLDIATEPVDPVLEADRFPLQGGRLVLQHLEIGLGLEERLRCSVGPIASGLDLAGRLLCGIVGHLCRRRRIERRRHDAECEHHGQAGGDDAHHAGEQPARRRARARCRRRHRRWEVHTVPEVS